MIKKGEKKHVSMRTGVFAGFLFFTVILLVILILFQTVYLRSFYKAIKKSELKSAVAEIIAALDDSVSDTDAIQHIAKQYDIGVLITNQDGQVVVEENERTWLLPAAKPLKEYYERVEAAGGELTLELEGDARSELSEEPKDWGKNPPPDDFKDVPKKGYGESVIFAKMISYQDTPSMLMVFSLITPIDATVQTLRIQLICISVMMIVLASGIALLLAKKMAKPLVNMNESAKELAKANYEVKFTGGEYREIDELAETLTYAAVQLGMTEQLQRELIANVSHDLRTPLTMIIAYAEAMRDLPDENTEENVQVVIDEASRLSGLVNDLLDISKLQAGVTKLELRDYDLTDSIEAVLMRYQKLVAQDGYQIVFEGGEEHIMVRADEFKIDQVIYNFINNAINYTDESKKVVVRQVIRGGKVRIEVQDFGQGIKEEELPYVWERYYKVDKVHQRAVKGTGLGLAIVKSILILHDAAYGVLSKEGAGSLFWFELPAI